MDRLNLVGEMAASIGHEVRNPITSIRGFLQLLKYKNVLPEYISYFDLMISEIDRANTIISEFLSLTKKHSFKQKKMNLNTIIASIKPLIEANIMLMDQTIEFDFGTIPDLWLDERGIKQLILNLVRNGLEAMDKNGRLRISTFCKDNKVVLAVEDRGTGIPENILSNIGTPFYTTKETGTGLGLPVCYDIAQKHDAVITFKTSSEGTTFYVEFKMMDDIPMPASQQDYDCILPVNPGFLPLKV